jgi:5-deoxy-glucuronate isomerase
MRSCGRIRKEMGNGWTRVTNGELRYLEMAVLQLGKDEDFVLHTEEREWAIVLIQGECRLAIKDRPNVDLGPRENPFEGMPYALFASRDQVITFDAPADCIFGIASSPAAEKLPNTVITPDQVDVSIRGAGNWTREVRKVCWSDNTDGNLLLAGETCTPSGNWSTIPPHRHQYEVEGVEASYEEIYFFQFSGPQGYGLIWQFDDAGEMDQAFSLKANDAVYQNEGYHPVVCGPGTTLYHLTFMAGPQRISQARVHDDYQYLLDDLEMGNQFTPK